MKTRKISFQSSISLEVFPTCNLANLKEIFYEILPFKKMQVNPVILGSA